MAARRVLMVNESERRRLSGLAAKLLLDGCEEIDVIETLQAEGAAPREAEEIVASVVDRETEDGS